jgi:hypothetical protein
MPDYGGDKGFGPGTTGGSLGGSSAGSGYGGSSYGGGGNGMSQATKDRLADMAKTDITNTEAEVAKSRLAEERERQMFSQKIQEQADKPGDIKYTDTLALYDALKTQNINPNQVNLKNYTTGPFAQKNVVMFGDKRIGQFGQVPTFGISGLVSSIFDLDTRNLMLDQSTFGDPFDGRGGNRPPDDIMEILYPSEETPMEEQPIEEQPVMPGYNLAFKDFYGQQLPTRGFSPMRNGGLASLPMNFNPMTNANPFSMMMRGGQI